MKKPKKSTKAKKVSLAGRVSALEKQIKANEAILKMVVADVLNDLIRASRKVNGSDRQA